MPSRYWPSPVVRTVRWWRRFHRVPGMHTYNTAWRFPWYVQMFRHPDRILGVAYWPAHLTLALTAGTLLWGGRDLVAAVLLAGLSTFLLLWGHTARVRARYGVVPPTDVTVFHGGLDAQCDD